MYLRFIWILALVLPGISQADQYLVRFQQTAPAALADFTDTFGGELALVSEAGQLYRWTTEDRVDLRTVRHPAVAYAQQNFTYGLLANPSLVKHRDALIANWNEVSLLPEATQPRATDNPAIEQPSVQATGADPLLSKSWGMGATGAIAAFNTYPQGRDIVVAITDTGVDYNHKDLINNMWRNAKEIPGDGVDNDGNGYVDDIVGWDFAANDNKPFDLTMSMFEIILQGGNPGHGTHVAGCVAATHNNSQGIAGPAPQAKIMALRFITEKGQGTTEAAIKSIDYAVDNGAHIINASWGGEKGSEPDVALQDAIRRAEAKGVIFVAAAGNGRVQGQAAVGFNNDTDPKPMVPASYDFPNMVAVAAIDSSNNLAAFSNFGQRTVKIGAPGVKVFSTVPGSKYQDTVINFGSMQVTWDGTSMASPFVSGALAVLWSDAPNDTFAAVRSRLFSKAEPTPALSGKVATGGRMSLR